MHAAPQIAQQIVSLHAHEIQIWHRPQLQAHASLRLNDKRRQRGGAARCGAAPPAVARRHAALNAPPRVTTRHRAPPHAKATQRQNTTEISSPLRTMMVNTMQEKQHCRLQSHYPCHCVRNVAHTKTQCTQMLPPRRRRWQHISARRRQHQLQSVRAKATILKRNVIMKMHRSAQKATMRTINAMTLIKQQRKHIKNRAKNMARKNKARFAAQVREQNAPHTAHSTTKSMPKTRRYDRCECKTRFCYTYALVAELITGRSVAARRCQPSSAARRRCRRRAAAPPAAHPTPSAAARTSTVHRIALL